MSTKSDNQRFDFLDHLRGLAVLAVFCFHSVGVGFGRDQLPWNGLTRSFDVSWSFLLILPATLGSAGVAVFFAVSGFCIHLSFQRNPDWGDYLFRRFFRIYPPFLVVLLFFALIYPFTRLGLAKWGDFLQLTSHLFLFHNLDQRLIFGINPAFWSIAVEVQLYVLYPVLLLLAARLGWKSTMVVLGIFEVLLRTLSYSLGIDLPRMVVSSPFTFWFSWSTGAYVAEACIKKEKLPFAAWPLGIMLLVSICSTYVSFLDGYGFLLFSLLTAAWISRCLLGATYPIRLPSVVLRHLRTAGVRSYSIYLIHQPLLVGIGKLLPHSKSNFLHHAPLRFAICIAAWFLIVPLSGLVYRWCELPSIACGKFLFNLSKGKGLKLAAVTASSAKPQPSFPEVNKL